MRGAPDHSVWGESSTLWKSCSEQVFDGDLDSLREAVSVAAHLVTCVLV